LLVALLYRCRAPPSGHVHRPWETIRRIPYSLTRPSAINNDSPSLRQPGTLPSLPSTTALEMESRNLSLRLPLPTPRLPMHRRTASSSSEASHASNASPRSNASEDQFVLSPSQTPAHENPPPRVMASRYAMDASAAKNSLLLGKGTSFQRLFPDVFCRTALSILALPTVYRPLFFVAGCGHGYPRLQVRQCVRDFALGDLQGCCGA
jgi:hypothetical protein